MLLMLRSILKLRPVIESIRDSPDQNTPIILRAAIPSSEDLDTVSTLIPILTEFETTTAFMSAEKHPTINYVCFKIKSLDVHLNKSIVEATRQNNEILLQFCSTMLRDVRRRFPSDGTKNVLYAKAALLNPCLKANLLRQNGTFEETFQAILREEDSNMGLSVDMGDEGDMEDDPNDDDDTRLMKSLAKEGNQSMPGLQIPLVNNRPTRAELTLYISTPIQVVKPDDQLKWWQQRQGQFPNLAKIVLKLFCIQATSCAVERTFSTSGMTITNKRTRLNPKNVHKLVFIRENFFKLNVKRLVTSNAEEEALEKAIEDY